MAAGGETTGFTEIDRQALATAVAVVVAVYIAMAMGLQQPYWAALSVMIISNVDRSALFTKGVLRVSATIIGVAGGYTIALWLEGQDIAQAFVLMLAAGIGIYGRQRSAYGYAWFYAALSFMLLMLCSMTTPEQLYAFAHYRCYEIVIGVAVATLANWAIGPGEERSLHIKATPTGVAAEDALWQAMAGALGSILLVIAWVIFDLPQLTQVLVSSLIIIDSNPAVTRKRGFQRILGCIVGGATGLAIITLNATNIIWWTSMLFLFSFLFARVHLGKSPNAYIGTQAAIGLLVTLVDAGPPTDIFAPIDRLVGIMLGVGLMTTVIWALNAHPPAVVAEEIAQDDARKAS